MNWTLLTTQFQIFYGIVDGEHRWMAALELQDEGASGFSNFMGSVSVLPSASFRTLVLVLRGFKIELNNSWFERFL